MATITIKKNRGKDEEKKKKNDRQIVEKIYKNANEWYEYYSDNIQNYRDNFDFLYKKDGMWTAAEITESTRMATFGKTRLTFNMLVKVINSLVGEYSESDPEFTVRPTDTANVDQQLTNKINVLTGLLRNISRKSRYDVVKKASFESALIGGFGAIKVFIDDEQRMGFNQTIKYGKISDPTTCFWDRTATEDDKLDGNFAGNCYIWKKTKFKATYPRAEIPVGDEINKSFDSFKWLTNDDIIIVDYWEKEFFKREIALLSDRRVMDADDAELEVAKSKKNMMMMAPLTVMQTKVIDDFKVKYSRVAGHTVLEEEEWLGSTLAIIFQAGILKEQAGKEYTFGLVDWLKDPQRSYNFARNETLWRLKLLRHEKWLVEDENIEGKGQAEKWKNAHLPSSALTFKRSKSGFVPVRIPPGEIPQALAVETQQSFNDMQQILGRFDANQGAPSNEQTGVAILRRKKGGNLSVKPFFDNAESAQQSLATVTLDLIPKVYDNDRLIQSTDENGKTKNVEVNNDKSGIDLTDGNFQVEVKIGPSFEEQKAEAVNLLLESYRANPAYAQISGDILARNLDIKDASLLADRVRTYLQPKITMDEASNKSQDEILKANIQQSEQAQQTKQQMMMQQLQLETMIKQQKSQDDKIKAMASQMGGIANLMNAQTNKAKAQVSGVLEQQKLQAEEDKARLELQKEALRLIGQGERAPS